MCRYLILPILDVHGVDSDPGSLQHTSRVFSYLVLPILSVHGVHSDQGFPQHTLSMSMYPLLPIPHVHVVDRPQYLDMLWDLVIKLNYLVCSPLVQA